MDWYYIVILDSLQLSHFEYSSGNIDKLPIRSVLKLTLYICTSTDTSVALIIGTSAGVVSPSMCAHCPFRTQPVLQMFSKWTKHIMVRGIAPALISILAEAIMLARVRTYSTSCTLIQRKS